MAYKYLPAISNLVDVNSFPDFLNLAEDVQSLLDNLYSACGRCYHRTTKLTAIIGKW